MTTVDRILNYLNNTPEGATDNQIAFYLRLPAASVRRTRSRLEDQQLVFFQDAQGPRKSNRYTTADHFAVGSRLPLPVDPTEDEMGII